MLKLACTVMFAGLMSAPVFAQTPDQGSVPDLRGTWKGESETVALGMGDHPHHGGGARADEMRFTSKAFTMTIDKQDDRRFSGTFSSERHTEAIIGVVSRSGTIYMVDDDGYDVARLLAPTRLEICYLHLSVTSRVASCTELTKQ